MLRNTCVMIIAGWLLPMASAKAQSFAAPALPEIPGKVFSITGYGAVGDGVATNTAAIQAAINAAAGAGGGIVEVPAGIFLSGPVAMASRVNLRVNGTLRMRRIWPTGS